MPNSATPPYAPLFEMVEPSTMQRIAKVLRNFFIRYTLTEKLSSICARYTGISNAKGTLSDVLVQIQVLQIVSTRTEAEIKKAKYEVLDSFNALKLKLNNLS